MRHLILLVALLAGALFAQNAPLPDGPWPLRALEPGACTQGQVYQNTTTGKVRVCSSTNTWSDLGLQPDLSGNVSVTGTATIGTTLPTSIGNSGVLVPVVISTSGPVAVSATGFYFNNASGALTYTLPTITSANVGLQVCVRNAVAKTGAITLTAPASTYIDVSGAVGSAAGTLVSGGALGDSACVVAVDTTHYYAYVGSGSWTNN
jgi:hypothetical protein